MPNHTLPDRAPTDHTDAAIAALDASIAAAQAARATLMAQRRAGTTDALYDADHLPPGATSWRQVLDLIRSGAIVGARRVGRRLVVPAEAWASYLASAQGDPRRRAPKTPKGADVLSLFGDRPWRGSK